MPTDLRHLDDVLEQTAAIRMMDLLRGRPFAQLALVIRDDAIQQDADVRIANLLDAAT